MAIDHKAFRSHLSSSDRGLIHLGADYTGLCVDCDTPLHSCEIEAAGDLCGFCLEARMEKNFNLFDSPDRPNQKPLSASAY